MDLLLTPEARDALIARVKNLLLQPKDEWPKIAAEPATIGGLYSSYVVYLAAVPVLCTLVGSLVFGYGFGAFTYRPSLFSAVTTAILQYAVQLGGVYVFALIAEALAPRFGGEKDRVSAFKLAAYSATASWLAGVFSLFPVLHVLSLLGLYSLYLLYTGVPVVMRVPTERALAFTGTLIAVGLVIGLVLAALIGALVPVPGPTDMGKAGGKISLPGGVNLDMDKLDKAAKRLDQMSKQAAQPAGEGAGEASESSGSRAIAPGDLKSLLPASLPGGFARTDISTASGGAAGFDFGNAKAVYAKGDARITLSATDMGAIGALAALGSAFGANASEETATSYSKMGQVDGHMTMEEFNRETKAGKFAVIVGDRVMIEAEGSGASVDELKAAVAAVDLGQAEALAK
ncbi:MAG: Yip1 family protein [Actinomycetota bacterium]